MQTNTRVFSPRLSGAWRWLTTLALTFGGLLGPVSVTQANDPTDCSTASTRTFELWAKSGGTLNLSDGTTTPLWGYTDSASGTPTLPGPTLKACQGDSISITLHNQLGEASSLAVHGQNLPADITGAVAGADKTYTFPSAAHAGTFLYQAGLTANGPKQSAMGLYGALVVYPATSGEAYTPTATNSDTHFDAEQLLVLSEIDPDLNQNPGAFDMQDYAPKYWLINGKSYPQTPALDVQPGNKLLVRYVNAGYFEHSMGLLGIDQTIIATNGYLYPYSHGAVSETVPPGNTLDSVITAPADAGALGQTFALYDTNQHLDNNGQSDANGTEFGGMATFVTVVDPPPSVTITSPSAPASVDTPTPGVTPTSTAPGIPLSGNAVVLQATASDNGTVTGVEFFALSVGGTATTPLDLGAGVLNTGTWNFTWDTTLVADGDYNLTAVATDNLGQSTTSDPLLVTIGNATPTATSTNTTETVTPTDVTDTPTPTPTATDTPTDVTDTPTPTPTATDTPTDVTDTPTPTPTVTDTPTDVTDTPTPTPTVTDTAIP